MRYPTTFIQYAMLQGQLFFVPLYVQKHNMPVVPGYYDRLYAEAVKSVSDACGLG